tara:strand:+ start:140 stop:445 length:306 start_codon:yes stop_codon:yes gene_type:complete
MATYDDPHLTEMATRAYHIQAKVEDIVAGRVQLKRDVQVQDGSSLARVLKDRRDLAILKQAVFDHLQIRTIPDQCRKEQRTMTPEQMYDAAKAHMETLMAD